MSDTIQFIALLFFSVGWGAVAVTPIADAYGALAAIALSICVIVPLSIWMAL